ncbi:MAG: lysophospholipid acyltransferase family protein [Pseudomonadota bacterium]
MRTAFFLAMRPLVWFILGLSVGNRAHLPRSGPAIVAANHNSHLDILVLLCSMPAQAIAATAPVAAADYFFRTPLRRFVATRIFGILALERTMRRGSEPFGPLLAHLEAGGILIIFPEGTRGAPEEMGALKSGLSKLVREAAVPVTPVYLQGAGRILPKGTRVPLPFTCAMLVGERLAPSADRAAFMAGLSAAFSALKSAAPPLHWH